MKTTKNYRKVRAPYAARGNRFEGVSSSAGLAVAAGGLLGTAAKTDCETERRVLRDVAKTLLKIKQGRAKA